jgi:hypothetical protein
MARTACSVSYRCLWFQHARKFIIQLKNYDDTHDLNHLCFYESDIIFNITALRRYIRRIKLATLGNHPSLAALLKLELLVGMCHLIPFPELAIATNTPYSINLLQARSPEIPNNLCTNHIPCRSCGLLALVNEDPWPSDVWSIGDLAGDEQVNSTSR